jgi:dipeptidase E
MAKKLLLASSSNLHGTGYLDHCEAQIKRLFGRSGRVLFVPYALHDRDSYAEKARQRFIPMGYGLDSVHVALDPQESVEQAAGFFIGGGNTFRLLKELYDQDLLERIRARVEAGAPYFGTSAGSNVACPTISTTNDMPILQPKSLDALNLVPFAINPHYVEPDPGSTHPRHMGETRDQRIAEFHEEHARPVVGLREGSMLFIEEGRVTLEGTRGARVFRRGQLPEDFEPGARLDFLLG